MTKNLLAASVGLSVQAGLEATYAVKARDAFGESIDLSTSIIDCVVNIKGEQHVYQLDYDAELDMLTLTFPALEAGRYTYTLEREGETGERTVLAQGVLGVFEHAALPEDLSEVQSPNRTLMLTFPDSGRQITAEWMASSSTLVAAYEAQQAAKIAKDAVERLEVLEAFVATFDGKIQSAIVMNPDTETWWIGGQNTGVSYKGHDGHSPYIDDKGHWKYWNDELQEWIDGGNARGQDGKDGRDGDTVVRHLVDSYDDIPQSGDTCNGGHYYYVGASTHATATLTLPENPSWDIGLVINSVHITTSADNQSGSTWAAAINNADCGVKATANGNVLTLTTKASGSSGNNVYYITYTTGAVYFTGGVDSDDYLVYAWLVNADNIGGWTLISDANSELIEGVKLSWHSTDDIEIPGRIGTNDDGEIITELKDGISSARTGESNTIGMTADGKLGVPFAQYYDDANGNRVRLPGAINLGSRYHQRNAATYLIGVGATADTKELSINLLYEGAIRHMSIANWVTYGQDWLADAMNESPSWYTEAFYSGLLTDIHFKQSSEKGLELVVAESISGSDTGVVTSNTLYNFLTLNYYAKDSVYTKDEVDAKMATKADAEDVPDNLSAVLDGKVNADTGVLETIKVLTSSEYNDLESLNPTTLYIITLG